MGTDRIDHRGLLADEEMAGCDGASSSSAAQLSWASASAASFFCRLSHPAIERAMLIALSKRRTQR